MKSAVIVIDMIKGLERWVPKKRILKALPNTATLLEKARAKRIPVIYIVHKPLGKKGTKIYEQIKPKKGDTKIYKNEYSSFYKTNLDKLLKKLKIKQLLLTGMATNWCVLATALDAHYHKYKIILLEDCVVAPDDKRHKAAIAWMRDSLDIEIGKSRRAI